MVITLMAEKEEPDWLRQARAGWAHTGQRRPPFAVTPGPGQESVWDYPRPPVIVRDTREVVVRHGDLLLARSRDARRVLETASPPTFYLPPEDVNVARLRAAPGSSFCEWKGRAQYWALADGDGTPVGWTYPTPFEAFSGLAGYFAFYPDRVACHVDGERVRAQAGGFYGGWITAEVVGPFKGDAGTAGW